MAFTQKNRRTHSRKKLFEQKQKNRFKKPLYKTRKRRSFSSNSFLNQKAYFVVSILLVVSVFYFVFYYSFFQIHNIIVSENTVVTEGEITESVENLFSGRSYLIFPARNIFVFNKEKVKEDLLNNNPLIAQVSFKKEFPDVLRVVVKEREIVCVWEQNSSLYFLSSDGLLVRNATLGEIESSDYPIVRNLQEKDLSLGSEATTPRIIHFIKKIDEQYEQATGKKVSHFELPSSHAFEVHVKTEEGPAVYFNLESSVESQLEALNLILRKEIEGKKQVEYIDLRVGSRVYYK
ncbi:FtsQ-type POTRA domain-containing protein [Patescibacteria group bacterium]|nr:FtsQ-type POTRA domain-containing protein [Patescibacteria group bacterium]